MAPHQTRINTRGAGDCYNFEMLVFNGPWIELHTYKNGELAHIQRINDVHLGPCREIAEMQEKLRELDKAIQVLLTAHETQGE